MSSSVVTIAYQDLLQFQRQADDSLSQRLVEQIGQAYGSDGLGILSVSGVPDLLELRQRLLPLAAKIPQLPEADLARCIVAEACYAVGWSHGKEELTPGVPDLSKGSFYANPLVNDLFQAMVQRRRQQQEGTVADKNYEEELKRIVKENPSFFAPNVFPLSLPELESAIADTGQCIARVGRLIARVCQVFCEQRGVTVDLEHILSESLNCKARLLHYFDTTHATIDSSSTTNTGTNDATQDQWWCGWHNDHGSLTGLVPAMYLSSSEADGRQQQPKQLLAAPDPKAGLYIQSRTKELVKVNLPTDCLGFQIGETFQILSGGLLQATPHAVKSTSTRGVTRETFAVFLEPEFDFPLSIPKGRTVDDCCPENEANKSLKLNSIKSRWKQGMSFGEFHNITTQTFHKQLEDS